MAICTSAEEIPKEQLFPSTICRCFSPRICIILQSVALGKPALSFPWHEREVLAL